MTLPTEMQWEWACRAGSESDFWYGALNTDFAAYENMGDKQLNKLAVRGVNPQPMSPGDPGTNTTHTSRKTIMSTTAIC